MINWNDPDYVSAGTSFEPCPIHLTALKISAGHFYALFQSVSVQCNDPTTPSASDTSYVYGTNSSLDLPSIAFSNASTMINDAPALMDISASAMSMWLGVSVALAFGGLVL
jgi:hypothetical protein